MSWKRKVNIESLYPTDDLPESVDPFAYSINMLLTGLHLSWSHFTIIMLAIFLVIHLTIAGFCLTILVLPHARGLGHRQWFVKRVHLRGPRMDTSVCTTPLYHFNAGTMMSIFQFFCSLSGEAYIWFQIKSALSGKPVPNSFVIFMGLMNLFELYTNWSMTHCILVTCYLSSRVQANGSNVITTGFPSPIIMNTIFAFLPLLATVVIVTSIVKQISLLRTIDAHMRHLFSLLGDGSAVWKRLQTSQPGQKQAQLASQLVQIKSYLKKEQEDVDHSAQKLILGFIWTHGAVFGLFSLFGMAFVYAFWRLTQRYRWKASESNGLSGHLHADSRQNHGITAHFATQAINTNQGSLRLLLTNRQFMLLALRVFAAVFGILMSMSSSLVCVINCSAIVTDSYWRGVEVWLVTVGSACSALPMAWQCWRLYVDADIQALPSTSSEIVHSKQQSGASGVSNFLLKNAGVTWASSPLEVE